MVDLMIPDALANRLRDLAQREKRSVADVLETMIEQYTETEEAAQPVNPLLRLAQAAEQADLRSGRADVSEHFDDVLNDLLDEDFGKRDDAQ
jgi:hypothetical protein